jgi:disulfide bond formation protein DsbB
MIQFTPMFELIRKVLTGSGECSEVSWKFLGLAMPGWVAICAVALGGLGVVVNSRRR